MVSIIEVEVIFFLPHPNSPDFDPKRCSKLGHLGSKMSQNDDLSELFPYCVLTVLSFLYKFS